MAENGTSYRPKVLVVEDDQYVLNLLDNVLTANDYEVIRAANGRIALERIQETIPDVIVSDIMMPEMNGYDLIRHVQSNERTRHIPFLFLSAKNEVNDRVDGLRIGADDYICKPFAIEELVARIAVRLSRQASLLSTISPLPKSMQGDLSVMSVVDLIQLLRFGAKTGEIVFHFSDGTGIIRMNRGDIVDISLKELSGERAFRNMIERGQGWFSFTLRDEAYPVKFEIDTQYLIVNSAKQIDDYHRLLDKLPDLEARYRPTVTALSRTLPGDLMDVITLFEGGATVREVLGRSLHDEMTTAAKIHRLFNEGFLEMMPVSREDSKPVLSILHLPDKYHDTLIDLLKRRPGIPSIILIALDSLTASAILERFCGSGEDHEMKDIQRVKRLLFKKAFIDGHYEINFYAIHGLGQYAFLHHIISEDMLGVFLAAGSPKDLLEEPIKQFVENVRENLMPLVTIQCIDEDHRPDDREMQARLVREYSDTVHHCRMDHDEDFLPVFDHWLRQLTKTGSTRKTR